MCAMWTARTSVAAMAKRPKPSLSSAMLRAICDNVVNQAITINWGWDVIWAQNFVWGRRAILSETPALTWLRAGLPWKVALAARAWNFTALPPHRIDHPLFRKFWKFAVHAPTFSCVYVCMKCAHSVHVYTCMYIQMFGRSKAYQVQIMHTCIDTYSKHMHACRQTYKCMHNTEEKKLASARCMHICKDMLTKYRSYMHAYIHIHHTHACMQTNILNAINTCIIHNTNTCMRWVHTHKNIRMIYYDTSQISSMHTCMKTCILATNCQAAKDTSTHILAHDTHRTHRWVFFDLYKTCACFPWSENM